MKTINIYSVPCINVEFDGIIHALRIHEPPGDVPHYLFDGARYELTEEEVERLREVMAWKQLD